MSTVEKRETYVDQGASQGEVTKRHLAVSPRGPWSPIQGIDLAFGLLFIVVGAVALIRTGINLNRLPGPIAHLWGLGFTSVSAMAVLVVGILLAVSAGSPATARSSAWCFGILEVAFGVIVALSPATFTRWWGFEARQGIALAVCGGLLLLGAALCPTFVSRSTRTSSAGGSE